MKKHAAWAGEESGDEEKELKESMNTFDIYKFLIIPHDAKLLNIWKTIESLLCLFTSFIYAWIAHFGIAQEHELFIYIVEGIFTL